MPPSPPQTGGNAPRVLPAFPGWEQTRVRAFFTTRQGGVSRGSYTSLNLGPFSGEDPGIIRRNWAILMESQGWPGREAVLPRLCHGATLIDADAAGAGEPADAVFTMEPGRVLAVTMADCLTALIADAETGCVAAVHAGWRGTRDNVLGQALDRLFAEGRCRPAGTRVALGPCLSPAALEVGEDVAATLPRRHLERQGGRLCFDLRGCNRAQALAAGLPQENITDVGGCTRENPGLFFSHRRAQAEGAAGTGRMAACIALVQRRPPDPSDLAG